MCIGTVCRQYNYLHLPEVVVAVLVGSTIQELRSLDVDALSGPGSSLGPPARGDGHGLLLLDQGLLHGRQGGGLGPGTTATHHLGAGGCGDGLGDGATGVLEVVEAVVVVVDVVDGRRPAATPPEPASLAEASILIAAAVIGQGHGRHHHHQQGKHGLKGRRREARSDQSTYTSTR